MDTKSLEKWNKSHPVGTKVRTHGKVVTTTATATIMAGVACVPVVADDGAVSYAVLDQVHEA